MSKQSTSFIVPVYNEAHRIDATIGRIVAFVESRPESSELIIVDDGSDDGTAARIGEIVRDHAGVRVLGYPQNRGKGAAIREGMLAARNDVVFFMDVDLATDLSAADAFLAAFSDPDVGIVIGTRSAPGARIGRHQPRLREVLGKLFTRLSNLAVPGVTDFTCGFKAYRRDIGRRLFRTGVVDDWSFDTEILYLARLGGVRIVEVPVAWNDVGGSKVRVLRNGMVCLYQLVMLPLRRVLGRYAPVSRHRA